MIARVNRKAGTARRVPMGPRFRKTKEVVGNATFFRIKAAAVHG